jgi:hypothetical protein
MSSLNVIVQRLVILPGADKIGYLTLELPDALECLLAES